ncbi:hypothetical protein K504DRAFT_49155 [Pleomassaria siparia CBS 279.74]|uniref:Uncharacterized protein n=1 Tax=Pleomassaria siparia CBS 279.74 TaxID=1314801 RepID=A0A6G1K2M1_9PLEO|nr:hypothetical protein K504DRAFT_49155 [Pleomassaria siparia CBS 279.74]
MLGLYGKGYMVSKMMQVPTCVSNASARHGQVRPTKDQGVSISVVILVLFSHTIHFSWSYSPCTSPAHGPHVSTTTLQLVPSRPPNINYTESERLPKSLPGYEPWKKNELLVVYSTEDRREEDGYGYVPDEKEVGIALESRKWATLSMHWISSSLQHEEGINVSFCY